MLKTNAAQEFTIVEALRCVADTYLGDAYAADQANNPRVAEQFRLQAQTARTLKAQIENGDLSHNCKGIK